MRKGRRRGPYSSKPYICRLYDKPDEVEERNLLDSWIEGALPYCNNEPSVAFRLVLLDLIRFRVGKPAPVPAMPSDTEGLRESILADVLAEVRSWLAEMLGDAARMDELATISQRVSDSGEPIDDSLLDNILEDFIGRT